MPAEASMKCTRHDGTCEFFAESRSVKAPNVAIRNTERFSLKRTRQDGTCDHTSCTRVSTRDTDCQKTPMYMPKETYAYIKRDLFVSTRDTDCFQKRHGVFFDEAS